MHTIIKDKKINQMNIIVNLMETIPNNLQQKSGKYGRFI